MPTLAPDCSGEIGCCSDPQVVAHPTLTAWKVSRSLWVGRGRFGSAVDALDSLLDEGNLDNDLAEVV